MKKLLTKYWPVTVFVLGGIISAIAYGAEAVHDHAKAENAKQTENTKQVAQSAAASMKAIALLIQEQRIAEMSDRKNEIESKVTQTEPERLRVLQIKKSLEAARLSVKTIGSM